MRIGQHIWQHRHFILDDHASPLRYHRIVHGAPQLDRYVAIDLWNASAIVQVT